MTSHLQCSTDAFGAAKADALTPSDRAQVEKAEGEGMPERTAAADASPRSPRRPAETTSLERRVLAHERILQSLIAHLSETEPRVMDRLREVFYEPNKMARREQDYSDTEDFAEEFIRAVVLLGEQPSRHGTSAPSAPMSRTSIASATEHVVDGSPGFLKPALVQIKERNGIWEVSVGGRFYGDYARQDHALEAAAVATRCAATKGSSDRGATEPVA